MCSILFFAFLMAPRSEKWCSDVGRCGRHQRGLGGVFFAHARLQGVARELSAVGDFATFRYGVSVDRPGAA